jgi:hypothetical protein
VSEYVTHESLSSVVGTVERTGATRRLEVRLPSDDASFPVGDVVRVVLDGSEYRARVDRTADGTPVFRGAYDTPSQARDPGGATNRLGDWVESEGLEAGRSVHVDVVEQGFKYGVRAPGGDATYESTGTPDAGLADIAASLGVDGEREDE